MSPSLFPRSRDCRGLRSGVGSSTCKNSYETKGHLETGHNSSTCGLVHKAHQSVLILQQLPSTFVPGSAALSITCAHHTKETSRAFQAVSGSWLRQVIRTHTHRNLVFPVPVSFNLHTGHTVQKCSDKRGLCGLHSACVTLPATPCSTR